MNVVEPSKAPSAEVTPPPDTHGRPHVDDGARHTVGRVGKRIVILGILVALIAALAAWSVVTHMGTAPGIEASGTIEATESDLSPKVQGRLLELRVHDGDAVRKGQVLAVLEGLDPSLNLDQARAGVTVAVAQVASAQAAHDLQQSTYRTTLAQASEGVRIAQVGLGQAGENLDIETHASSIAVDQSQAQLRAAHAAYDHATIDLGRARSLVETGDLPRQALDDAVNEHAEAAAQLQAANDAVALAQANRRNVQIRQLGVRAARSQRYQSVAALQSAQAERELVAQRSAQLLAAKGQLAQARAALGLAQDQVRETQLVAPFDGYVVSHNFEVGDLVQSSSAVLTVGNLDHPYVYVYVGESDLPHVKTGSRADMRIDGLPKRIFVGTVTEISSTAEFTPENVQTKEQRIEYLVFRIKIELTDTTGSLKPGLPADAVIYE